MQQLKNKGTAFLTLAASAVLMSGCAGLNGIRTPLYDGEPFETDEEAVEAYKTSHEVIGETQENYFRYELSEDLRQPSLDFTGEEPFLIEEGSYVIGEDIPSGRVHLMGSYSAFQEAVVHIGNLTIYDETGNIFFEHHFHSEFGELLAEVDLYEGHTIEVIGQTPNITALYEEEIPADMLSEDMMFAEEEIEDIEMAEEIEEDFVELNSGIYEVGVHLQAGEYEVTNFNARRATELFLFRGEEEPRVFELTHSITQGLQPSGMELPFTREELESDYESGYMSEQDYEYFLQFFEDTAERDPITFVFEEGDKLYFNMISLIELREVE